MFEKIMRAIRPTAPESNPADASPESYPRSGLRFACRGARFQASDPRFADAARRAEEREKTVWLADAKRRSDALEAKLRAAEGRP